MHIIAIMGDIGMKTSSEGYFRLACSVVLMAVGDYRHLAKKRAKQGYLSLKNEKEFKEVEEYLKNANDPFFDYIKIANPSFDTDNFLKYAKAKRVNNKKVEGWEKRRRSYANRKAQANRD